MHYTQQIWYNILHHYISPHSEQCPIELEIVHKCGSPFPPLNKFSILFVPAYVISLTVLWVIGLSLQLGSLSLIFIYLFLERGEGREKERNINWLLLIHSRPVTKPKS